MMAESRKIFIWFASASLLLALLLVVVFLLFNQIQQARAWRQQSDTVLDLANHLLSAMKDAETGQRGYFLTRNKAFLEPYLTVKDDLETHLANLNRLSQYDPVQLQLALAVKQSAQAKLDDLRETIQLFQEGQQQQALLRVEGGQGLRLMDQFRGDSNRFIQREASLHLQQETVLEASWRSLLVWVAVLGTAAVLVSFTAFWLLYGEIMRRLRLEDANNALLEKSNAQLVETQGLMQAQHQATLEERERRIQLEKMSALGIMVGGVAHEINNPLMGLINFVEFARDKASDTKSIEVLNNALHEIDRIKQIVRNMLIFVRVDASHSDTCDVSDTVGWTTSLLEGGFRKNEIRLVVELPTDLFPVRCSSASLQQVLVNLLLNAQDALLTQAERRIVLSGYQEGEHVILMVCDNGRGIDSDLAAKIFVPFFSTKPPGKGTGLGLSVSRQLIEEVGGTLNLHSQPGYSTCFKITLNISSEEKKK